MRVKKIIASATSVLIAATVIRLCPIQPIMADNNMIVDKISSDLNNEINNNPSDYYPVVLWGKGLADSVVEEAIKEEIG